jgi:phospholipase C
MGPNWVASVVDANGNGPDWDSTAIFITWDDCGYYDHVPPCVVRDAAGVGFRVPLMIVSPYTKPGCMLKANTEFGTLLKFTEDTFNLGSLGTKAVDQSPFINNLSECFDWTHKNKFQSVTGALSTAYWQTRFGRSLPTARDQIRDE